MENPVIVSVLLKDGVDQNTFVSSFDSVSEVELHDLVESLVSLVVLKVEKSYLPTLRSNSSVKEVEDPDIVIEPLAYPSEPSDLVITGKTVGWTPVNTSSRGDSNLSLQHYYDNDSLIRTTSDAQFIGNEVFGETSFEDSSTIDQGSHTFRNKYNGEHVDIVIAELATTPNASENHGETHPDFRKHDDSSVYRWNKVNWGITNNNQTGGDPLFGSHGLKSLSVAIGLNSGYGKKSNGYIIYGSGGSTVSELNAIKTWHDNKSINPTTGLKNPTIVTYEFGFNSTMFEYAIKIDDIVSITGPSGTTNRPDGGWGTDFTPFINLHMIPRKLLDPIDSNWYWVMTFPRQGTGHRSSTFKTATEQLWDLALQSLKVVVIFHTLMQMRMTRMIIIALSQEQPLCINLQDGILYL